MCQFWPIECLGFDFVIPKLNGGITIRLLRFYLCYGAWPRLNDGDRNRSSFLIEDLGHAEFSAEDTDRHGGVLLFLHHNKVRFSIFFEFALSPQIFSPY